MTYHAMDREILFTLRHVIGAERLNETERFADMMGDTAEAVLGEAGRLAAEILAPLQRPGDLHPAVLENGIVRTAPGYADGYRAIAEGGWVGMAADPEHGGMGLPMVLATGVNEMFSSACLSLSLNPLMTQGQIEALEAHASDAIKAIYLPKLIAGEWTGTMNLTEPQAGSDVGALSSRATDNGDGTYSVSGQKIYISWGDHDFGGNVCHLVLARLPDGAPGTKGISLFLVPKYLPDAEGNPGRMNSLKPISLEHKLGLHGSPTAVMEYDGATGWMVGAAHGGMAAMFTMMNNARLGVGGQGLGVAEAATQKAMAYAADRKQGRTADGSASIAGHADVRRMLMQMRAQTNMARGLCLDCAYAGDMARAEGGDWGGRAAFLTPIAKAFGTDTGCEVAGLGIQVHGGMGFIEETGAAQYLRDVRVTAIYEGTNGIQAMDLVGRKLMDGGAAARAVLDGLAKDAEGSAELGAAIAALHAATDWMLAQAPNDRFAGATRYLRAFALTLGTAYLIRAGKADAARAPLAVFAAQQMLPEVAALCQAACIGAEPLYAMPLETLAC